MSVNERYVTSKLDCDSLLITTTNCILLTSNIWLRGDTPKLSKTIAYIRTSTDKQDW
jgi:hypothetical protein